jgi:hypothetical protein
MGKKYQGTTRVNSHTINEGSRGKNEGTFQQKSNGTKT